MRSKYVPASVYVVSNMDAMFVVLFLDFYKHPLTRIENITRASEYIDHLSVR